MTDTQSPAPVNTDATAQNGTVAGIEVLAQYVKDLSFENPNAPESLLAGWGAPESNVEINMQARNVRDSIYETILTFKVEAVFKAQNKTAFITELAYGATARLNNIPQEHHQAVLMVELPKLIFPFAREVIARAAQQGGYPPIYLQPMNFEAAYVAEVRRRAHTQGDVQEKQSA